LGGVRTREDPTRPKEPDPHHNGLRGVQRGERVIYGFRWNWRGELVVRVSFGD